MGCDQHVYAGSYLCINTEKDLYELMGVKLDNGDLFRTVKIAGVAGQILISNLSDPRSQGGLCLDEEGVWNFPKSDFSHPDWIRVMSMFEKEKMPFEQKCGILMWWY